MRWPLALPALLALAACGGGGGEVARPARAAPPLAVPGSALAPAPVSIDGVRGQNARALIARFGKPQIDLQEGRARKLQFAGSACVLDIYLYPRGRGEPVATHLDTRLRNGAPVDPASCLATLGPVPTP